MRLTFGYTNWRGIDATRVAEPVSLRVGATKWHPEAQWLMLAVDAERNEEREFAVADMRAVGGEGLAVALARLPVTTPGAEGWADLVAVDGRFSVVAA